MLQQTVKAVWVFLILFCDLITEDNLALKQMAYLGCHGHDWVFGDFDTFSDI